MRKPPASYGAGLLFFDDILKLFYNYFMKVVGFLNPMIAAGAMAFLSVSVAGNSLGIKRQKIL